MICRFWNTVIFFLSLFLSYSSFHRQLNVCILIFSSHKIIMCTYMKMYVFPSIVFGGFIQRWSHISIIKVCCRFYWTVHSIVAVWCVLSCYLLLKHLACTFLWLFTTMWQHPLLRWTFPLQLTMTEHKARTNFSVLFCNCVVFFSSPSAHNRNLIRFRPWIFYISPNIV